MKSKRTHKVEDVTERIEGKMGEYNFYWGDGSNRTPVSPPQQLILDQMKPGRWYDSGSARMESLFSLVKKRQLIYGRNKFMDMRHPEDVLLDVIFNGHSEPFIIFRLVEEADRPKPEPTERGCRAGRSATVPALQQKGRGGKGVARSSPTKESTEE